MRESAAIANLAWDGVTEMSVATPQSGETIALAERSFALGLGLTNECNLACSFCYRDRTRVDRLSLDQVRGVLGRLPVRSVNLGTGENGLHPEFAAMLDYLRRQPIKLTITSNGYSLASLEDAHVPEFTDVQSTLDSALE